MSDVPNEKFCPEKSKPAEDTADSPGPAKAVSLSHDGQNMNQRLFKEKMYQQNKHQEG